MIQHRWGSAAAVALLLPALGSVAMPAWSAPAPTPGTAASSLAFHAPDTAPSTVVIHAGVPGVQFSVARVGGIDLLTPEGWAQAKDIVDNPAHAADRLGEARLSAPTDAAGDTTIDGLPVGLYVVHEIVPDGGAPSLGASDVVVALPLGDPTATPVQWTHRVEMFPKKDTPVLHKSVADGMRGVAEHDAPVPGTILTYGLDASIPVGVVHGYRVRDDLDAQTASDGAPASRYLEYRGDGFAGSVRASARVNGAETALRPCAAAVTPECDYVVTLTPGAAQLELTPAGLAVLQRGRRVDAHATWHIDLAARVRPAVADATRSAGLRILNQAQLTPGDRTVPVPSNTVTSIFAALRLHKLDAGTGAGLAGAGFTVYRTRDDALARRDALAVSELSTADGRATIAGLHVTDFQNDAAADDSYWLVETTVPTGYRGLHEPAEVKLGEQGVLSGADEVGLRVLNASNPGDAGGIVPPGSPETPAPGPRVGLPHTGAVGHVVTTLERHPAASTGIGGLALVAAGLLVWRRRRATGERA